MVTRITFFSLLWSLNHTSHLYTFSPSYFFHFHCSSETSLSVEAYLSSPQDTIAFTASSIVPSSLSFRKVMKCFISPHQVYITLCVIHTLLFHSICLTVCSWFTANHFLFHLFCFIGRHHGVGKRERAILHLNSISE